MTTLYINGDLRAIEKALVEEPKIAKRAAISALNKVAAKAQTQGVKQLGAAVKIPAKAIKSRVKLVKANARRLRVSIITLTAGYPIDRLPNRKLRKGFSAAGRKFPHAFVAYSAERGTAKQKTLIFERKSKARLPIERVKIEIRAEADAIFGRVVNRMVSFELPKVFESEIKYRRSL